MSATERIEPMTIEEFVRLYEREGPFELIDGERKPMMPNVLTHGKIIRILFRILDAFCVAHGLGEVFFDLPFVMTYSSDWVKGSLVPDLMFFSTTRWQPYERDTTDAGKKPIMLVPDLAVEVISPNDSYTELQDKVARYLADGVRLIWAVDPQKQQVHVFDGNQYRMLGAGDTLTGSDVIPGLSIPLAELFQVEA